MPEQVRAFWIASPGRGEIRTEELPHPAGHEVVVRAVYSAVSRGTESLVFSGRVPESEWERMRAPFQSGSFPAPVKYGYSSVGIVDSGPPELVGRPVFVLFPHQTRYVVPAAAVHVLPEGVPPERAVLAANMETAVTVLWDARPHAGDRIAVIGGGVVGCLAAALCARVAGCEVELVDINAARAPVASALGVAFSAPEFARPEADLVIHASGSPDGLRLALELAGMEGRIIEASWFGDQRVSLPLGETFHSRRLTITSSQVGHIPPLQRPRWDSARRMQLALRLLHDPVFDVLITGESAFDDLPTVMERLAPSPNDALCHRIRY